MKTFVIKYETYGGMVRTEEKTAYNEQHATNQLINCKKVYWIREKEQIGDTLYHIKAATTNETT